MLVRIMTEPRNCIYRQFRRSSRTKVSTSQSQREHLRRSPTSRSSKSGRQPAGLFEEVITPVLYAVPDHPEIKRVEIASLFTEPALLARPLCSRAEASLATLAARRRVVFGLALASFVLSFFHRTAPAASPRNWRAFDISSAVLGTLAATYFYVYTCRRFRRRLADTSGRAGCTAGSAVAAGSLLFALAPAWEVAAVGRALVSIGSSVAFISVLKLSAVWFAPQRFATLAGITMLVGNLGAVIAGAPLAWIVTQTSWRAVFVALAILSGVLARATWWRVRDRPEDCGFTAVNPPAPASARVLWLTALGHVLTNPATWPPFLVNAGVGGLSCLRPAVGRATLAGCTRHVASRGRRALEPCCCWGGSDHGHRHDLGSTRQPSRPDARCGAAVHLSWLPWLLHAHWPIWATLRVVPVDGSRDPRFYSVVDDRQGRQTRCGIRHRNFGRQHRHIPRRRHPAAARRLGARPGQGQRGSGGCLGSRADGAGRSRSDALVAAALPARIAR